MLLIKEVHPKSMDSSLLQNILPLFVIQENLSIIQRKIWYFIW